MAWELRSTINESDGRYMTWPFLPHVCPTPHLRVWSAHRKVFEVLIFTEMKIEKEMADLAFENSALICLSHSRRRARRILSNFAPPFNNTPLSIPQAFSTVLNSPLISEFIYLFSIENGVEKRRIWQKYWYQILLMLFLGNSTCTVEIIIWEKQSVF